MDVDISVGYHHTIINIGTYVWWAAWMGTHQREVEDIIYQRNNMSFGYIYNFARLEEMCPPTCISTNETNASTSV